jgi:hypothetical protein
MEAPLSICTKEEIRGVIRFLFEEGVKPVEIIRRMQARYGDNCRAVKFTSRQITSKREELLYVMRRDQEGSQRQGLRTIFKPLKEWYGKTDESQGTTLRWFPYVWPMKEALRGRRFSSDEDVIGTVQNLLKNQKTPFLTELKNL